MKDILVAIRALLLSDPAVSAAVGGSRIYPVTLAQGVTDPSVVLNLITETADYEMRRPSGLGVARVQTDSWALSSDPARNLGGLVHDKLSGFSGTINYGSSSPQQQLVVRGIFVDTAGDDYDSIAKLYTRRRDFLVWYNQDLTADQVFGPDGGNAIPGHVAIGNAAKVDHITFAPGDPVYELTYQVPVALVVNESFQGDLNFQPDGFVESISNYAGFAHTGTQTTTLLGLDTEIAILGTSTGPIQYAAATESDIYVYGASSIQDAECLTSVLNHFGSGAIDFAAALVGQVHHRTTTGTINTGYGLWTAVAADVGTTGANTLVAGHFEYASGWTLGTIQNLVGVEIEDMSGKAIVKSLNLWSKGAASNNLFEGIVRLGTASNPTPQTGDLWFDGTNLKFRKPGTTVTLA